MVGEVEGFGVEVCSQRRAQAADHLRDEAYPFLLGARALVFKPWNSSNAFASCRSAVSKPPVNQW
jgi:hypothetical protein